MKEITHEELKKIQIGILDSVHDFCEKHGIVYFLSSGTLLGAVRHKGYIPWDDDLDIYMLRPDYDRFIKLFSENPCKNMCLLSLETSAMYQYPFAKVIDDRTVLIEKVFGENFKLGVYMDIFPIESVPDRPVIFLLWFWIEMQIRRLSSLALDAQERKSKFFLNARTPLRRVLKFMIYPFARLFSFRVYLKIYDAIAKKYNKSSRYIYNLSCGAGVHSCFRRKAVERTVDIEFEGKNYKTMVGYKEYLYVTYGDFMQLPPPEKRVSNHSFTAWRK